MIIYYLFNKCYLSVRSTVGTVLCVESMRWFDGPRACPHDAHVLGQRQVSCEHFDWLNDSIGYRNVIKFYEEGKILDEWTLKSQGKVSWEAVPCSV